MKERCNNPKCKAFPYYGGRGITVCDEWQKSYTSFCEWAMANGFEVGLSIDRIDNDKGYYPENCRWTTAKEQSRNRGDYNTVITFNGKTQCVSAWAEELGISDSALRLRIKKGLPEEDIFYTGTVRVFKQNGMYSRDRLVTYRGQTKSLLKWSEETGVPFGTICMRIRKGKTDSNLFDKEFLEADPQ